MVLGNAPPPWVRDQMEINVQQGMAHHQEQEVIRQIRRDLAILRAEQAERKAEEEAMKPMNCGSTMNTTAETLDATTSTFTTPEGSVTIGSVDTDRNGHQVSIRVKDNEGNEVALFFTPELADRFYGAVMTRSSEVRNARRR